MTDKTHKNQSKFNLSQWALNQKPLVIFMMLLTLMLGLESYFKLSRNEDPPFTIKTLVVSSQWPGASTEDTTNLLTDKIEEKLQELPYIDRIDSYSRNGESVVMLNLRDETPPKLLPEVWYQARKKINEIKHTLPYGVQGPFIDDEFGETFGMIYGLVPEGFTLKDSREELEKIRAKLMTIKDIGKIILLGVQEQQIQLEFSSKKLASLGLNADSVIQLIESQNAVIPAGTIRLKQETIGVRVTGAFGSEEEIGNTNLNINQKLIPIREIATIKRISVDPPTPMFRVNGKPAIGIAISMNANGNLLDFGKAIRQKMENINKSLPHGLELEVVADQSKVVDESIKGFIKVLIEAILIVLAVSFVSLGSRAGLVVTLSIPLVLALTFFGMQLTGIGLQRISLGALIIALGLLVDDAMITVETMVSKVEEGWKLNQAATYAYETTAFPMLSGTLVMIAGFIPVGFAESSAGEYCYSMFMVVLISLLASWVVAVLFSPLIGTWILPSQIKAHSHQESRWIKSFSKQLGHLLTQPIKVILVCVAVLVISLIAAQSLKPQFFPTSDRPELLVNLNLPQNASIDATLSRVNQVEKVLNKSAEVSHFSSYIGSGAIRFYLPMDVLLSNENIGQIVVVTKSLEDREHLRLKLQKHFDVHFNDITTRIVPLELGPPVGWPIKYRVTGPDINKVKEYSTELASLISKNPNVKDANLTTGEPKKSVVVEIKQNQASVLGFTSKDIASFLAATYSGVEITSLREGKRLIPVIAIADANDRKNLAQLENMQITSPNGKTIPLSQVASISYGIQEPIIWKRQREPIITVQADVSDGVLPAMVSAQLMDSIKSFNNKLNEGYVVTEGGAVEEAEKGNSSVLAVLPAMIIVMLSLLMIQLRSFSRVMIALAMAPFGMIGVVAAMLPTGTPMGFVAQLGVIALIGMIIRNAIILIEEVDANVKKGLQIDESIKQAVIHRARPIVLTACAAILGMIPIASQVFWGPMAYAVIGGLAVATILTLILLPCFLKLLLAHENKLLQEGLS